MASRSTNRTLAAALTRGDRSTIGRWFWTIDKTLLIIIFALVAAGIVAVAAASRPLPAGFRAPRCALTISISSIASWVGWRWVCR